MAKYKIDWGKLYSPEDVETTDPAPPIAQQAVTFQGKHIGFVQRNPSGAGYIAMVQADHGGGIQFPKVLPDPETALDLVVRSHVALVYVGQEIDAACEERRKALIKDETVGEVTQDLLARHAEALRVISSESEMTDERKQAVERVLAETDALLAHQTRRHQQEAAQMETPNIAQDIEGQHEPPVRPEDEPNGDE